MINEIPGTSSKRIKITKNNTAEAKSIQKTHSQDRENLNKLNNSLTNIINIDNLKG